MSDLVQRLRGEYRIPITDGLGSAGGEEPDNPHEFVRTFQTSPIMHEAADRIEQLEADLKAIHSALDSAVGDSDAIHVESDDELRAHAPVQWAAMRLAALIQQAQ